ncbi:hypothetical protein LN893_02790 [Pontibacter sp. XAAS-A31]|nr:hypothetical protein [Pontibacter harenae]
MILSYTGFLVLLACLFLMVDTSLFNRLQGQLPNTFMVRFAFFWFLSFILTLCVFLCNLNYNYIGLPLNDKIVSLRVCKLLLALGVVMGATFSILFFTMKLF